MAVTPGVSIRVPRSAHFANWPAQNARLLPTAGLRCDSTPRPRALPALNRVEQRNPSHPGHPRRAYAGRHRHHGLEGMGQATVAARPGRQENQCGRAHAEGVHLPHLPRHHSVFPVGVQLWLAGHAEQVRRGPPALPPSPNRGCPCISSPGAPVRPRGAARRVPSPRRRTAASAGMPMTTD